jgi:hypothetical protein
MLKVKRTLTSAAGAGTEAMEAFGRLGGHA